MGKLTAPAHLPADVAAVWLEINTENGNPFSGPSFEAYCGQVARLREAQRRVSIEGLVIADPKGNPVPHPAIQIEKQAQAEIRAWGTKFMPRRRVGL